MTDHYAVIGNPISHSKSPLIHTEFAKQTNQDIDYVAIEIPLDDLAGSLNKLKNEGYKGINITVPFKEQALAICLNQHSKVFNLKPIDEKTVKMGATNTLIFDDSGYSAFNTDGIGLCNDLILNHNIELKNKRILILGAGGAARGTIGNLLGCEPRELVIANRTASKAGDLAELFNEFGTLSGCGFDDITGTFDIVINATSASLQGEVPPLPNSLLNDGACCYDMMYSNTDTAFIRWAKQHNAAKTIDGLGMLVEQAAEAFRIWRGVKPETKGVIQKIRQL